MGDRDRTRKSHRPVQMSSSIQVNLPDSYQLHQSFSMSTASSTSSACPSGLTLGQTLRTTPSLSMRNVSRFTPMYFLPNIFFSFHTPYSCETVVSVSASRGKDKPYLSASF